GKFQPMGGPTGTRYTHFRLGAPFGRHEFQASARFGAALQPRPIAKDYLSDWADVAAAVGCGRVSGSSQTGAEPQSAMHESPRKATLLPK
ncbi:MAG: hypothetical protein QOD29_1319, partial [Alphaproteobacteria bacterium]|nr:hypothetical protein [Alphaproteobacteria bacterium]